MIVTQSNFIGINNNYLDSDAIDDPPIICKILCSIVQNTRASIGGSIPNIHSIGNDDITQYIIMRYKSGLINVCLV